MYPEQCRSRWASSARIVSFLQLCRAEKWVIALSYIQRFWTTWAISFLWHSGLLLCRVSDFVRSRHHRQTREWILDCAKLFPNSVRKVRVFEILNCAWYGCRREMMTGKVVGRSSPPDEHGANIIGWRFTATGNYNMSRDLRLGWSANKRELTHTGGLHQHCVHVSRTSWGFFSSLCHCTWYC